MPYLDPNANQQRNNITSALMNIQNPQPQTQYPPAPTLAQGGGMPQMPNMPPPGGPPQGMPPNAGMPPPSLPAGAPRRRRWRQACQASRPAQCQPAQMPGQQGLRLGRRKWACRTRTRASAPARAHRRKGY